MRILLLAGGGGTRLWPLSTEERPKQFLPLLSEKSLLAETYERVRPLSPEVFVATSARHAALVRARAAGPARRPHLHGARAAQLGPRGPRRGRALRAPTAIP